MTKMILKKLNNDYVIELWGMSTKHADFIYSFKKYVETEYDERLQDFATIDDNFIQWVAHIASHQLFQYHAIKVLNAGFAIYTEFPDDDIPKISDILKTHVIEWEDNKVYGIEIEK
jgi:hypothetical protein